eukprot:scaffold8847_cov112-Isochrysis_galbana.AAC.6
MRLDACGRSCRLSSISRCRTGQSGLYNGCTASASPRADIHASRSAQYRPERSLAPSLPQRDRSARSRSSSESRRWSVSHSSAGCSSAASLGEAPAPPDGGGS